VGGEAIDVAHFTLDDNGKDHSQSWECLHKPDSLRDLDPIEDAFFESVDLILDQVQQLELLFHTASGLLGHGAD